MVPGWMVPVLVVPGRTVPELVVPGRAVLGQALMVLGQALMAPIPPPERP